MEPEPMSSDDRPEVAATAESAQQQQPLEWRFAQVFGERAVGEDVQEVDIISAIEFDKSGDHLATGDRGGRVVLFERTDSGDIASRRELERQEYPIARHTEYRYRTEFQSHEPETSHGRVFWNLYFTAWVACYGGNVSSLCFAHSDDETFISADDLRINLWNLEINNQSFNIVDMKPANMEDLTEVITCAEFHPTHCNTLAYSSSKGTIRLIDLRQSALCDNHAKLFEEHDAPGSRSFFTEIIASVSDIKFARDGRHILSRDYMTLKLWDLNMDSGPVATFQVHEYLRPKLCDLYENDSIFDKFECCLSGDGHRVATGSYSNLFRVFGCTPESTEASTLEASRNPMRSVKY
ncbi:Serine/threonine protein phosphatase 2A 55 kDa regulatory subunit B beta isoform [Dichanthelium oligosanthes]|uniref:Serine/threonine-protein phosphatase 2A 55 kDa regulatory subunit B n=1 Tax=Dichanthelium oligosanthes TaxID=888268 RepID=A0A1E5VVU5_9POAL|nr:Serine/threonine protein phosphatase 2A 55 kDa regulatory subunit B beta isoform [Dichanthelium oligosanthes]